MQTYDIRIVLTCDQKCQHLLLGLDGSQSNHPCPFCHSLRQYRHCKAWKALGKIKNRLNYGVDEENNQPLTEPWYSHQADKRIVEETEASPVLKSLCQINGTALVEQMLVVPSLHLKLSVSSLITASLEFRLKITLGICIIT